MTGAPRSKTRTPRLGATSLPGRDSWRELRPDDQAARLVADVLRGKRQTQVRAIAGPARERAVLGVQVVRLGADRVVVVASDYFTPNFKFYAVGEWLPQRDRLNAKWGVGG